MPLKNKHVNMILNISNKFTKSCTKKLKARSQISTKEKSISE